MSEAPRTQAHAGSTPPALTTDALHALYERLRAQHRVRRRRARRLLKPLPRRGNLSRYPIIRRFAEAARKRPYLWSFKRGPVLRALYIGTALSLLPTYGIQIFIVFLAAIVARANVTVMCALQFLNNPLTAAPIYYATYRTGLWTLGLVGLGDEPIGWGTRVAALFVGGILLGVAASFLVDLVWRLAVWEARHFRAQMAQARAALGELHASPPPP